MRSAVQDCLLPLANQFPEVIDCDSGLFRVLPDGVPLIRVMAAKLDMVQGFGGVHCAAV